MPCALALTACADPPADDDNLLVFAAASTGEAVQELTRLHQRRSGQRVRLSIAASSTLARQLLAGARADVFVSANQAWMDELQEAGLLRPQSRQDVASNRLLMLGLREPAQPLVAAGPSPSPQLLGRLAMADPAHVPAGIYGKQALQKLGWWQPLQSRILPAPDVRAALRLAQSGEADAALVYASDRDDSMRDWILLPDSLHAPIRYPAALLRDAGQGAEALLGLLAGAEGQAAFARAGFGPAGGGR